MEYELREWGVVTDNDPFKAPEIIRKCLVGYRSPDNCAGHHRVVTSDIVSVDGRRITTLSGSVYVLVGPPSAKYMDYLTSIGRPYDPHDPEPIKVR